MNIGFLEIFSMYIMAMAVYGIPIFFRYSLPCYIIENLSTSLDDVEQCLNSATTIGVIPAENRADLERYGIRVFTRRGRLTDLHSLADDLARMRIQSHHSPGFFQQTELGFRRGLTYRLYLLSSRIRAVKIRIEVR
jgi:hypothetical protein